MTDVAPVGNAAPASLRPRRPSLRVLPHLAAGDRYASGHRPYPSPALGGSDEPDNLCAACYRCNEYRGVKTHDIDPLTGELAPLFNPRVQTWHEHLAWANGGIHLIGLTPTGRATVRALRLNNDYVVEARALWIARQWHPPVE